MTDRYDIIIAGAGLAGASFGLAAAQGGLKVVMIDPQPFDAQLAPSFDGRSTAIAFATFRMLDAIGVGEAMRPHACRMDRILVTDGRRPGAATPAPSPAFLRFDADEIADGVGGPVDFHAMAISRADSKVIYGLYGGVQVSRDGGETWTSTGPGPDQVIDLAAASTAADTVYAGTAGGLMQSTDAGKTWTLLGPQGQPATMVEATADGSLYVFFAGIGLFQLPKDGKSVALASDFGERYILHLTADPADAAHLVAVTDESAVLESQDGGKTWQGFGK